jgi:predicted acetyltransferase
MKVESVYNDHNIEVGRYIIENNEIYIICIDPEFRQQGHATKLVKQLLNSGEIKGPSEALLNPYMVRIYKKLGSFNFEIYNHVCISNTIDQQHEHLLSMQEVTMNDVDQLCKSYDTLKNLYPE